MSVYRVRLRSNAGGRLLRVVLYVKHDRIFFHVGKDSAVELNEGVLKQVDLLLLF